MGEVVGPQPGLAPVGLSLGRWVEGAPTSTAIPTVYRANFTNTRGVVYTPYAAGTVVVQNLGFQMVDQPWKQGVLLIGRRMVGTRPVRSKAAVELAIA